MRHHQIKKPTYWFVFTLEYIIRNVTLIKRWDYTKNSQSKQKKFAHELVTNEGRMTKYECAIAAGYAKDSARVRASELTNPKNIH